MAVLALLVLLAVLAPAAHAARITLGSDLRAPATVTLAQGADTAYWPTAVEGAGVRIPADGQIVQVKVKGSAMREQGAGDPATMVHFQSLDPPARDGSRRIYLTSAAAYLPVDQPGAISSFEPENLCVRKGGALAFNTIGGFRWGGSLDAPPSDDYLRGTPWRIFAAAPDSTTAWYSKDNGTNNGDTVRPSGGTGAREGYGARNRGQELLMQFVLATGRDRSEPCGGPRRHPDGSLVEVPEQELRVAGAGRQRPYVTRDRRFSTGVYCQTRGRACRGRAILRVAGRTVAEVPVRVPSMSSARVPMRLPAAHFRILDRQGFYRVTYVLVSQFGRTVTRLSLNR